MCTDAGVYAHTDTHSDKSAFKESAGVYQRKHFHLCVVSFSPRVFIFTHYFHCVTTVKITAPPVHSLRSRQSVWRAESFWPRWGCLAKGTALPLSEPLDSLQPAWRAARWISIVRPPGNAALMAVDTLAKPQPIYIKVKEAVWGLLSFF